MSAPASAPLSICIRTSVERLGPLLRRTLVLVAHPDDDAIGCGVLLQQMHDPIVVFATDGAPRQKFFWEAYGSREAYAQTRAEEVERALSLANILHFHFLSEDAPVTDQELYLHLQHAYETLAELVEMEMPDAILSHAYEGGHPDHDACCLLASVIARRYQLPVWEFPLYHRADGEMRRQAFVDPAGEIIVNPAENERMRKRDMIAAYASQAQATSEFMEREERFRPMRDYDFSQPPHAGATNYEAWQWPMKSSELCRAFTALLEKQSTLTRDQEWDLVR